MPIAEHVRIRGDAARIVKNHVVNHFFLVLIREINLPKWNFKRSPHTHGIKPVLSPRALNEFRPPYLDERTDDVIALALQQCGRDGAIYPTRESTKNSPHICTVRIANKKETPRPSIRRRQSKIQSPFRHGTITARSNTHTFSARGLVP